MTSIGATSPCSSQMSAIQQQLAKSVSSGQVNASDQNALSSALSDIDGALQSTNLSGAAPSKSTLDGLISNEVSKGTLTSDQAVELQSVFGSYASANGISPPSDTSGSSLTSLLRADTSSSSSGDNSPSNASTSSNDTVTTFLKLLKESSVSAYTASGTTSGSISALLLNIQT